MSIQRALALATLTVASITIATAATTYGSQATLEASTPGLTFDTVNLTSLIGQSFLSSITDPLTGVIFSTSGGQMSVLDATTIRSVGTLTVTLPSTVVAFGAYTNSASMFFHGNLSLQGDAFIGGDFLGYRVAAGPIPAFSYTFTSGNLDLHGFEIGSSSGGESLPGVPETGTLVSMAGGLILLGLIKRRGRPCLL